ncbi:Replication factor A protein 1 [Entamoeba marina]
MSITVDCLIQLVCEEEINSSVIVQLLSVERSIKNRLIFKTEISDTVHSITAIIKCRTESEANSLKQFCLIKITQGYLHVLADPSKPLVFVVFAFEMVNNSVINQIGLNIAGITRTSQPLDCFIPSDIQPINKLVSLGSPIKNSLSTSSKDVLPTNTSTLSIDLSKEKITPFSMLVQNNSKFVVKGVVISKGDKVLCKKGGYLFNFVLQDTDGSELKCICFEDTCEKYHNTIFLDKTYFIYRGKLQQFNPKLYRTGRMIDLECIIKSYSLVQQSNESIPKISAITPIKELDNCAVGSLYSICCIIVKLGEIEKVKDKIKRTVEVIDQTNWLIDIILWEEDAKNIPDAFSPGDIIKFDNLKLCEFNRKYVTFTHLTKCEINPSCDEANIITWDNVNEFPVITQPQTQCPNPLMSLNDFYDAVLNSNNRKITADVIACVYAIKTDSISYIACDKCKKKVDVNITTCLNCNKQYIPQHRYKLALAIKDTTKSIWVVIFDEVATNYLNISAHDLINLKESNPKEYSRLFEDKMDTHARFVLTGNIEKYDDEDRVNVIVKHIEFPIVEIGENEELKEIIEVL